MQLNLSSLPDDILLAILGFQGLADVLIFPLVCRAFNAIAQKRALWIRALHSERLRRPIACPAHTDLAALTLADLKRIARRTYRLQRTWTTEQPTPLRVVGPIKAVELSVPDTLAEEPNGDMGLLDLIFQVPGTEYYVFHSRLTGELVVWDVGAARQVTRGLYVARRIMDVSAGQQTEGRFWMGLLVSESQFSFSLNRVMVVCLEYDAPEAAGPSLTITFAYAFKPGLSHWAIFMTKEYIGALECVPSLDLDSPMDAYIRVIAVNIATARQTLITTDILREDLALGVAHSGTSTVNDDTFILFEDNLTSHVFLVPRAALPHNANRDARNHHHLENTPYTFTPEGALSANDAYGVPRSRCIPWRRRPGTTRAGAIAGAQYAGPLLGACIVRRGGSGGGASAHARAQMDRQRPGALQDSPDSAWKLMLLSHSGRSVLLVMDLDTHLELRLVAVDPELDRCAVHRLAVPPFIELDHVYGLSIDDHRGVITLLDTRGVLFALPYA
ncbi:hypothetical protein BJ912DRAFT_1051621 [Pholiota molesta]|nr:hypothetical protein BJ912DRAFT_1051621 [Pholiota molesta]